MKNYFILSSLIVLAACGSNETEKKTVNSAALAGVEQNCEPDQKDCPIYSSPAPMPNGTIVYRSGDTVYTAPTLGTNAAVPDSYTFLDTPDANLCVDAFIRKGITLPANTVARTLDARSVKAKGIAIADIETSLVPILNVVHLRQDYSDVMFQFYNRAGYYCIVKSTSNFSHVRFQRSCAAQIAEVEPMTHDTVSGSLNLWWFFPQANDNASQGSYNSRITELPCIP